MLLIGGSLLSTLLTLIIAQRLLQVFYLDVIQANLVSGLTKLRVDNRL